MTATIIVMGTLFSVMLVSYIVFKHEHREEERTEAYLYRHRNDADKLAATEEVSAAYKELEALGILK